MLVARTAVADVWQDVAGYNYGDEPNPCEQAEKILADTDPSEYAEIEDKLISVVNATDATKDGKSIACRFLQQVGSEKCIPTVSALLDDAFLSHYARLVLQRLESDAADKAMLDALTRVPNSAKIGILGSLAERGDRDAVRPAARLAASSDSAVAAAAIDALGKIGGADAARLLTALKVRADLRPHRMRAMVACAASLPPKESAALCEEVLTGPYGPARVAALKQLAVVAPVEAAAAIARAITGSDAKLRQGAFAAIAGTENPALTRDMVSLLKRLEDEQKASLITALGTRGDRTALEPVGKYVSSSDPGVRRAAVKAVGKLGDENVVKFLLDAVDSPQMSETVTRAIVSMKGDKIDAVLVDALETESLKEPAIRVCIARGTNEAVPALLKLTQDSDSDVRKDAWSGLGALAGAGSIGTIMDLALDGSQKTDLSRVESALKSIIARASDRGKCFEVIAARYARAPVDVRGMILRLGPAVGDTNALSLEARALESANDKLSGAALRALTNWPNESAAPKLLYLAKNADSGTDRIVALRGYIRIAGLKSARIPDDKRVEMLRTAMDIATRTEEKKQVIGALQNVRSVSSVKMLARYIDDSALQNEAQMAAANLLWNMRRSNSEDLKSIAKKLTQSDNKTVADRAKRALDELSK